jgi:hypothetical protein
MVDEVGVVKGLRGYGIKEEFAHAKSATAAMGAENVSTLAPLDLPPPKQGCCSAGGGLVAYAKALCQMSKCGEGEELVFIRGLYDVGPLGPTPAQAGMLLRRGWFGRLREGFVPNVEMCELEKEMDKDESVVFRVGWATR